MFHKKIIFSLLLLFSSHQLLSSEQFPFDQIPEKYLLGGILTVSVGAVLSRKSPNWGQCFISFITNFLSSKENLLTSAIASRNTKMVAQLLADFTIDINKKVGLWPPLKMAVELENKEIVKLLLTRPDIDVNNESPLWRAICNNNMEIIKLLFMRPDLDINGGFHLVYATHRNNVELMKLFLKHPSTIVAVVDKMDNVSQLRLWNALAEIAETDWKTIESLRARNQITDEELLYHFPEKITYANTSSLLTHACTHEMKEEDNIFFGDWDSEQKNIHWYSLSHRSFVDFCITSKGNLNNRNKDELRPLDLVSRWYLSANDVNGEKEQLYYSLLRATPALTFQTLYDALLTKYPSKDVAQRLMESYIMVMIPKLPTHLLNQKIFDLTTKSNKTQSTLLLTTK
jgi:hypothetical protein